MRTSEQTNEIMAAIAKAQAAIKNPPKNKTNPHFKSKYADLADGLDVIRPALSAQNIAILQAPHIEGNFVLLTTRLGHSSGQWVECDYPVGTLTTHQKLGADLTYAKRQSAFSIVGVCGDDDLDGEDSSEQIVPAKHKPRPVDDFPGDRPVPSRKEVPKEYLNLLYGMIDTYSGDADGLKTWWNAEKPNMAARGLASDDPTFRDLYDKFVAKGKAIAAAEKERKAA